MKKTLTLFSAAVLMSALCVGLMACNDEPERKMDTASFLKTLQSAPAELTTRDLLPEWLNDKIDFHTEESSALTKVQVFKGELNGRVVYYIYDILGSCISCDFYDEMGEKLTEGQYDSEGWVLVWEFVGEIYTRSEFVDDRQMAEDEYIFPQLSDEWGLGETVQSRLDALQIPESVLSTISTAGLLETCLNFPYIIDILFGNDYQRGFEMLMAEFNGFRELMKRPDLTNTLLIKYNRTNKEVETIQLQKDIDKGMFAFRHFVLEMMLAQDVVLETLTVEQEKHLFAMSIEQTKTEQRNPDVFGGLNALSTSLLYAKKMANNAHVMQKAELINFIQSPLYIDQKTMQYLEDYVTVKYR